MILENEWWMKYLGLEHKEIPKDTLKYICIRYTQNGQLLCVAVQDVHNVTLEMKMPMLILVLQKSVKRIHTLNMYTPQATNTHIHHNGHMQGFS